MYQVNAIISRKEITFKDEAYDPSTYQIKNLKTGKIEIEFEGYKNVMRYLTEKKCITYNWDKDLVVNEEVTGFDYTRPLAVPFIDE